MVEKLENEALRLEMAVRRVCEANGRRKSVASIRRLVGENFETYGPKEACASLQNLGFEATFVNISQKQLELEELPLIAFDKEQNPLVLIERKSDGSYVVIRDKRAKNSEIISQSDFENIFMGYIVSIRKLSEFELQQRRGHWFFGAFKSSRWLYAQVIVASVISNFLALTTSIFTMTVYDRIIPNSAVDSLIALSIGVVIALSFDFIIRTIRGRFIDKASKAADIEVSNTLFDRVLSLTPAEQSQKTGAMASIIKEFETLREFFTSSTLVILVDLPFAFFFIYVISLIAGPMALVPLVAVPIVVVVGLLIQPFIARLTKATQQTGMNKQSVLVETLSGLETVNATGSGQLMKSRYIEALIGQSQSGGKSRNISQFLVNFSASVQQYAQVGAIFYGVFLIRDGLITQGALIAAVILGGRTLAPLAQLANALTRVNGAMTAYKSLNALLKNFNNAGLNDNYVSRSKLTGSIEFKNVSFSFPGAVEPTIKDLSIKITPGQKVAVVGKMGSGKSTLIKLISGLYEPTEGAVLIDGIDVRQLDKTDLQHNVGVMLQDSWLFSGTVKENIQLGLLEYDDDHILSVAKISGVDDFVASNPKGYDFEIKERGVGLSGGQKQSINLARALLHDPRLLLLDEPTSSMDQGTEKKIVDNLHEYGKEKTMVIITHRNPILTMVDRVLVVENGKVVADNTPDQLGLKK
ncbi:MAG: type I secretion system permease/ATPase [Paracoccaceae bacterium]|nr:type I secretion system permease/ATPase [Paracoccaceae bacterium]